MAKRFLNASYMPSRAVEDIVRPFTMPEIVEFPISPKELVSPKNSIHLFYALLSVLMFCTCAFLVSSVERTISYFSDGEFSLANALAAGELDFDVSSETALDVLVESDANGSQTIVPIVTPLTGSFTLEYRVHAEETGGSSSFCTALQLSATTTPFIYNGPLLLLHTDDTATSGPWQFALSLPDGSPDVTDGDICNVDLVYQGWTKGETEGAGYTDTERISLTIHAVIPNEIISQEIESFISLSGDEPTNSSSTERMLLGPSAILEGAHTDEGSEIITDPIPFEVVSSEDH